MARMEAMEEAVEERVGVIEEAVGQRVEAVEGAVEEQVGATEEAVEEQVEAVEVERRTAPLCTERPQAGQQTWFAIKTDSTQQPLAN